MVPRGVESGSTIGRWVGGGPSLIGAPAPGLNLLPTYGSAKTRVASWSAASICSPWGPHFYQAIGPDVCRGRLEANRSERGIWAITEVDEGPRVVITPGQRSGSGPSPRALSGEQTKAARGAFVRWLDGLSKQQRLSSDPPDAKFAALARELESGTIASLGSSGPGT